MSRCLGGARQLHGIAWQEGLYVYESMKYQPYNPIYKHTDTHADKTVGTHACLRQIQTNTAMRECAGL